MVCFPTGYGGQITYGVDFTWDRQARVAVYITGSDSDWNIRLLENLKERKDEIESDLGSSLNWETSGTRTTWWRIAIYRPGSVEDDADTLEEIRLWMVENLIKFEQICNPRLAKLAE